ncbi:phage tail protein [Pedobacter cryoconitis]|uniref:Microcystin-dependent protein n=1 Tax=Pedobacter cryoconitis TaxID=188932 RepID=A0A7X0J6I1_9SPHI|nr:tail fiber protein [Pedobacter cryoconitis]MBB6502003.1 microcystin-dependent protein [Pedobacter cryoconitis]
MSDFLGSISMFTFNFPPRGYAQCDGQLLAINTNAALFSLLGTTYGGNGVTTFALPDFRGRTPLHYGTGSYTLGATSGEESHLLTLTEIPLHSHTFGAGYVRAKAGSTTANATAPENNYYASNPALTTRFSNRADTAMYNNGPFNTQQVGSGQAHENRMPFVVLNFVIALTGIFPSRN